MFLQAVRDAEDFLMSGSGTNKIKMAKQSSAPIATGNNVTMGSPDSGIVEGPWMQLICKLCMAWLLWLNNIPINNKIYVMKEPKTLK